MISSVWAGALDALLPRQQDLVDQLGDQLVLVDRVGVDQSLSRGSLSRHLSLSLRLVGLGPVPGPGLLAVADAGGVEHPANDLVADAREVLRGTAAHEHDGVLLQVVTDAGDAR
jgi:hypothetical protein